MRSLKRLNKDMNLPIEYYLLSKRKFMTLWTQTKQCLRHSAPSDFNNVNVSSSNRKNRLTIPFFVTNLWAYRTIL